VGTGDANGYVIPQRYWAWIGTRRTLAVLLWLVALGVGAHQLWHARTWFRYRGPTPDTHTRADGNEGHAQIDFGGQWVMGRMLVMGHGHELYHRQRQWEIVNAAYPIENESPVQRDESILPRYQRIHAEYHEDVRHDADRMMYWFMGSDSPAWQTAGGATVAPLATGIPANPFATIALNAASTDAVSPTVVAEVEKPAIGGPLYPPVHAFLYAPLGLIDHPQDAYALFQYLAVGFAYIAGLGVSRLTGGRIWWSLASIVILLYPGCRATLDLAQNSTLSLMILVWGWVLASRNRDWAGGAVWGLLAFKPSWAMAFFLVPLLMRRWRFCLSMVGTGAVLGLLTLPFVGVQAWFDWLAVGNEAAALYNVNLNWINLSRDLQGIPRRFLIDFALPEADRDTSLARNLAWGLWGVVFATTVLVYLLRADHRKPLGLGAGFLFLGAFLCCYRFMYYDVLLSALAIAVLLADPWRYFHTRVFDLKFTLQSPLGIAKPSQETSPESGSSPPPLWGRSLRSEAEQRVGGEAIESDSPLHASPTRGEVNVSESHASSCRTSRLIGYVNSFPLTILLFLYVLDNSLLGMQVEATFGVGYLGRTVTAPNGSTSFVIPRIQADSALFYPWDTVLLLLLWLWCAVRLIRGDDRPQLVS